MIRTTSALFIPRNLTRLISLLAFIFTPSFPDSLAKALDNIRLYTLLMEGKAMAWWSQNLYELSADMLTLAFGPLADLREYQFATPIKPPPKALATDKKKEEGMKQKPAKAVAGTGIVNDLPATFSAPSREETIVVDDDQDEKDGGGDGGGDDDCRSSSSGSGKDDCSDDQEEHHHHCPEDGDNDQNDEAGGGDGDQRSDIDREEANEERRDPDDDDFHNNDNDSGGDGDVDNPLVHDLENVAMYGGAGPRDLPDGGPDDDPSSTAACCSLPSPVQVPSLTVTQKEKQSRRPDPLRYASMLTECLVKCPTLLSPLEYTVTPSYATITSSLPNSTPCTLVTQCSVDRFPQLKSQIIAWNGAVSVAIYVPSPDHHEILTTVDTFIAHLRSTLTASGRHHIVVSLLFGHDCESKKHLWDLLTGRPEEEPVAPLYPINNLRNLAVGAARSIINSPLLFLVDVDFIPSLGLSSWIEQANSPTCSRPLVCRCDSGEVFVVPAFERDADFEMDSENLIESLVEGWDCGAITPFHVAHFPAGHQPTDFDR
jgi:hypothetical protein